MLLRFGRGEELLHLRDHRRTDLAPSLRRWRRVEHGVACDQSPAPRLLQRLARRCGKSHRPRRQAASLQLAVELVEVDRAQRHHLARRERRPYVSPRHPLVGLERLRLGASRANCSSRAAGCGLASRASSNEVGQSECQQLPIGGKNLGAFSPQVTDLGLQRARRSGRRERTTGADDGERTTGFEPPTF